jgi:CcmD family protein
MSYLFSAYTIVWIILCIYVFRLAKQSRSMRKDLIDLRERMESQRKEG